MADHEQPLLPAEEEEQRPVNLNKLINKEIKYVILESTLLLILFYICMVCLYGFGSFKSAIVDVPVPSSSSSIDTVTSDNDNENLITKIINGVYLSTITISSVGFGDIITTSDLSKMLICVLIIVGTGYLYRYVDSIVSYVISLKEIEKGNISFWWKNTIIVAAAISFGIVQIFVVGYVESYGILDSVYLAVVSSSTVGYGDRSFDTPNSKLFAAFSLFFAPLVFGKFFQYLVEWRIKSRRQRIEGLILGEPEEETKWWTVADVITDERLIKRNFYSIYKLQRQGKISKKDLEAAQQHFDVTYPPPQQIPAQDLAVANPQHVDLDANLQVAAHLQGDNNV